MARSTTPPAGPSDGWGISAIALAAALWAVAAAIASRLFDRGIDPFELAEARSFIAFAGLCLLPAARRPAQRPSPGIRILWLGLSIALVNTTYYVAIDRLPVAVALVFQYTAPAGVVAWTVLVQHKKVGAPVVAALLGAIAGVVLVSQLAVAEIAEVDLLGVAAALGSAVFFAAYTLLSESVARSYGPVGGLARGFGVAAIAWAAFQAARGWPAELFDPSNLGLVLYVGVGGTLAPFLLYVWGVQRVRSARGSIAATLEPVVGGAVGWVWLGQHLTAMQLAGGALVVGAVLSLQRASGSSGAEPRTEPLNRGLGTDDTVAEEELA
ncbi:MAG: EamA family transporter [Actinomycetota bacterium]|nr:EamA family transporter [Actinomycetota bacterium]